VAFSVNRENILIKAGIYLLAMERCKVGLRADSLVRIAV